MYAVIRTGGKQYRVAEGDVVRIEKVPGEVGSEITFAEVLAVNVAIVGLTALLELSPGTRSERTAILVYDRLELLQPGKEAELNADLGKRIGMRVLRVTIQRVDLLR